LAAVSRVATDAGSLGCCPASASREFKRSSNSGEGLRWSGSDDGYLGFPRTYPEFLPKALLRKLERMIDREIAAHARKSEAQRKRRSRTPRKGVR